MRIISIDPGFGRIGVAILEKTQKEKLLFSDCLETDSKSPLSDRLKIIGEAINKIIKDWSPEEMAIEKLFFAKNTTTALSVAEAKGVIVYEAAKAGIPVYEYEPVKIKLTVTGHGGADKSQVTKMVGLILGIHLEKKLDDEYDAMAIGITHLALGNQYRNIIHK